MHSSKSLPWLSGTIWAVAAVNLAISTYLIVFHAVGGSETNVLYPAFQAVVAVVTTEVLFAICVIRGRAGNAAMRRVSYLLLGVSAISQGVKVFSYSDLSSASGWINLSIALVFGAMSVIGVAVLAYYDSTEKSFPRETITDELVAKIFTDPIKMPETVAEPAPPAPKKRQLPAPATGTNKMVAAILAEHPDWTSGQVHAEMRLRGSTVTVEAVRKSEAWRSRTIVARPTPVTEQGGAAPTPIVEGA